MGKIKRSPVTDVEDIFGTYINAFRVTEDGEGCFLDFLLYSEVEKIAVLVSRVWVPEDLVPEIHGCLVQALADLTGTYATEIEEERISVV